jgi:phosphoribosyl 1,2-cyclic phosphodiesterase
MLSFSVLASSSSGNVAFVATPRTRLLIDAGLSAKETFSRLEALGQRPEDIDAILITHEHSDHIAGLPALAGKLQRLKRCSLPVYLTRLTAPQIDWGNTTATVTEFQAGTRFTIGDIEVTSFTIPHDAVDPVGFTFCADGRKVGLATDLGYIPDSIKYHLTDSDVLMLESNHDLDMLKVGPYPWSVKQRVMSRKGPLSNEHACQFILDDLSASVRHLVLGHLSEHNNHPEICRLVAAQALDRRGLNTELTVIESAGRPGFAL